MTTRTKPLIVALAMALGASAPAFAQSSGTATDNTNSRTAPRVVAPAPSSTAIPVYSPDSTPVVSGSMSTTTLTPADEDARERAARQSRATTEEEHGGLRNGLKDKKARTREKLGMPQDDD